MTQSIKPRYVLQTRPALSISFQQVLDHLALPLVPLVSISNGLPHPKFPTTLLEYHLLTSAQLDDLARYYHQVSPPVRETYGYPERVPGWISADGEVVECGLDTKRRRFGRFVGLRGCESPTVDDREGGDLEKKMEEQWQDALKRAREDDGDRLLRRKVGGF